MLLINIATGFVLAMSKRFDCQFSGLTYSLGETGYPLMVLVTLEGCA